VRVGLGFALFVVATNTFALVAAACIFSDALQRRVPRARLLGIVGVGFVLVAVPTVFAVFPAEIGNGSLDIRIGVGLLWVVAALIAGMVAASGDYDLFTRSVRLQQQALTVKRIEGLLYPGILGIPEQYRFSIFVPEGKLLMPMYPPALNKADPSIFVTGTGVVGELWYHQQAVRVVAGPDVSSGHRLDLLQQEVYRHYEVVVAAMIRGPGGKGSPAGVLTAIAERDDGHFGNVDNVETFRRFAETLHWLLPHGTMWMLPDKELGRYAARRRTD
jgi:hypothetical protein